MVVVTSWLISWRWFFQMLLIKTHYYENKRKRIFDTNLFSLSHDDVDCLPCLRTFDSNCTFYFYFRDVKICCIFSVLNFNKLVLVKKQGNLERHTCWRICHWWLEKLCIAVFEKTHFSKSDLKHALALYKLRSPHWPPPPPPPLLLYWLHCSPACTNKKEAQQP